MTDQHYYYGTGRRKSAVARVRLYPTPGGIPVNGRPANEALPAEKMIFEATAPLRAVEMMDNVTVVAKITGGGTSGQSGALAHGIARALQVAEPSLRSPLKKAGLLTRDAREKERKKYGLRGARAAKQWTKR